MGYIFTQKARIEGSKWEIKVDPVAMYGYFEHDVHGEGGGLWFETIDGKVHLSDYDGLSMLPKNVWLAVESLGYVVTDDFK